jgi:predicted Rossmann fold flavoprotein
METLLAGFGRRDLLDMLGEIGVLAHKTSDGWYYPISESAAAVVDAFASALERAGVHLRLETQVTAIRAGAQSFTVHYARGGREAEEPFERVIVAAGGKAYPSLGSRGELFAVLEGLGHTVLPLRPALAPVLAEAVALKPLQGQRLDVGATLWRGSQRLAVTRGNLIFTEWGLNGPAVMDLSHQVSAHPGERLELSLDLLAFFNEEYDQLLAAKRGSDLPLRVLLEAFLPPKVAHAYLKNNRLDLDLALRQVSDGGLARLKAALNDTRLAVKGVREFEYCQVSAGGVPVTEADPRTLESLRVPGLYLCGETLDVVGPCGGYNLQYAFSSGALAGRAAARE